MKIKHRVLVITMYCGEPQIERCIKSVKSQEGVACTHKLITNKPNVEAHKELYEIINENKENFSYFIKLDADMEFSNKHSLLKLIGFCDEDTDHFTIPVFDFFTKSDMPELHLFSNRVYFDTKNMDNLYVDNVKTIYPGKRKSEKTSRKLILHCYKPSMEQAFFFGIHRALKVVQTNSQTPSLSSAYNQYNILLRTFRNFRESSSEKDIRYYSLLGASLVFSGVIKGTIKDKGQTMQEVGALKTKLPSPIDSYFEGVPLFSLLHILGFKRALLGLLRTITLDLPRTAKKIIYRLIP